MTASSFFSKKGSNDKKQFICERKFIKQPKNYFHNEEIIRYSNGKEVCNLKIGYYKQRGTFVLSERERQEKPVHLIIQKTDKTKDIDVNVDHFYKEKTIFVGTFTDTLIEANKILRKLSQPLVFACEHKKPNIDHTAPFW